MVTGFVRGRIRRLLVLVVVLVAGIVLSGLNSSAAPGSPPTISKEYFGQADGTSVYRYTLANGDMRVRILSYGGIVQSLSVPDRFGHSADVVLGFPTLADYVANNSPASGSGVYFGALVGRYANRIAKGTFTLNGQTYHIPINNNGNTLHGGTDGFDKKVWNATEIPGSDTAGLRLSLVSPDGDQGFPGALTATVTYTLNNANQLRIHYQASTTKPTVVNLTNHTYWNLAGESSGTVYGQRLRINANSYTPTDSTQIPTGQIAPVRGTPFDFRQPTAIGARINDDNQQLLYANGYDDNWVLSKPSPTALSLAAQASDPLSGRTLTVLTTQPGLQFYTGNGLNGSLVGTGGKIYRQSDGFALETQHFPNSPNQPNFPSTVLNPGQTYDQTTIDQLG
jgi:aldose 1-epimerase